MIRRPIRNGTLVRVKNLSISDDTVFVVIEFRKRGLEWSKSHYVLKDLNHKYYVACERKDLTPLSREEAMVELL
jgi:hypothetical protein